LGCTVDVEPPPLDDATDDELVLSKLPTEPADSLAPTPEFLLALVGSRLVDLFLPCSNTLAGTEAVFRIDGLRILVVELGAAAECESVFPVLTAPVDGVEFDEDESRLDLLFNSFSFLAVGLGGKCASSSSE
jgi:hypothetical protein